MGSTVEPKDQPPKPPKPPDPQTNSQQRTTPLSFKDGLIETANNLSQVYEEKHDTDMELDTGKNSDKGTNNEQDVIYLSKEKLHRLYLLWRNSVIIKVFGRRIPYIYLKQKLQDLWQPSELVTLIDLGNDYHVVKFHLEDNRNKVIHEGPWFIARNFISVRKWEPNFVPKEKTIIHIAIWARLPQLPTEFYDKKILEKVREKLGTLLKIDACTSDTLRAGTPEYAFRWPPISLLRAKSL